MTSIHHLVLLYNDISDNPPLGNTCLFLQNSSSPVAIKSITKKNLSKSHNLLGKEIKILKVTISIIIPSNCCRSFVKKAVSNFQKAIF